MGKRHSMDSVLQEKKRELQLEKAFESGNAASATDCTGAVPKAPETKEELENYEETYSFQPKSVR